MPDAKDSCLVDGCNKRLVVRLINFFYNNPETVFEFSSMKKKKRLGTNQLAT